MKALAPRSQPISFQGMAPCLAALLMISSSHAATVSAVAWGGQYVDSDLSFADDDPIARSGSDKYGDPDGPIDTGGNNSIAGRSLSHTTPLNPGVGYSGTSGTFYGGGSVSRENSGLTNDGYSELSVLNQGPNDSLHWHVDTGGDSHTFHLLLYWDKGDFLNGLSTTTNVDLSQGGFTLSTAQASANHTDELLRWVVRDGSQFFVSESTITLANNSDYSVMYSNLANWAAYNPVDPVGTPTAADLWSLDFDEGSVFSPHTFTDVTAVGFYMEHEAATGPIHVHIEGFGATFIPEPSSILLLLGSLGLVARRRRR